MSLAQDYLDRGEINLEYYAGGAHDPKLRGFIQWAHSVLIESLTMPLGSNSAGTIAERFVFHQDVPALVGRMIKDGQIDAALPMQVARLPADPTWVEYPIVWDSTGARGRVGMLCATINDMLRVILVASSEKVESLPTISAGFSLQDRPPWPSIDNRFARVHWYTSKLGPALTDDEMRDLNRHALDLLDCLFLLNIPRVAELRTAEWGPKKQRAREAAGKPPLVELRHIELKIGQAPPRYQRDGARDPNSRESEDARHKRLHRVIGHMRVYREGRETPHVAYVPEHWRGDPELGVLLHERKVSG